MFQVLLQTDPELAGDDLGRQNVQLSFRFIDFQLDVFVLWGTEYHPFFSIFASLPLVLVLIVSSHPLSWFLCIFLHFSIYLQVE